MKIFNNLFTIVFLLIGGIVWYSYVPPFPTDDVKVQQIDTKSSVLIENQFDTIMFNTTTNNADWVCWKLTKAKVETKKTKRASAFTVDDTDLLKEDNKVSSADYTNSRYHRGHLCPAADCKFSNKAMADCMEMTNITPQTSALNEGVWKSLEDKCRDWAVKYGTIHIVAGPIYSKDIQYIGNKHKIAIPDKFFKCVLFYKPNKQAKAIGFIFDNKSNPNKSLYKSSMTVDEVERITGFDFFSWMPDDIEDKIENSADLNDW